MDPAGLPVSRRIAWYRAARVVSEAIEGGDTRAALAVLRGLGLLDGQRVDIPADDPKAMQAEADLRAREDESERRLRELCVFSL